MIDNQPITDNNDNVNDKNENDVVIRLEDLTPINDINCQHYFVKDHDEMAEKNNMQAWICQKCKRGTFLPKDKNIINS